MWRQARARLFIYLFTFLLKLKYTILEIRESQDLAKDFRRTVRSWKGNKATGKKIYELKNILNLYKETKQNYNNQNED